MHQFETALHVESAKMRQIEQEMRGVYFVGVSATAVGFTSISLGSLGHDRSQASISPRTANTGLRFVP
jgi:hypothetical protein